MRDPYFFGSLFNERKIIIILLEDYNEHDYSKDLTNVSIRYKNIRHIKKISKINLGGKMKDYEIYSTMKVPKNSNIIIRLDGRKFHSLAKGLNLVKPYDKNFYRVMSQVCEDLFKEFSPLF